MLINNDNNESEVHQKTTDQVLLSADLNGEIVGLSASGPGFEPYTSFYRNDYNIKNANNASNIITMGGIYSTVLYNNNNKITSFTIPLPKKMANGTIFHASFSGAIFAKILNEPLYMQGGSYFNPADSGNPALTGFIKFQIDFPLQLDPSSNISLTGNWLVIAS